MKWVVAALVAGLMSAAAFGHAAFAQSGSSQAFPAKPITLICPWPAGGSTDIHLRKMAQLASKYLGQPAVVENKPGASAPAGPTTMAKTARPDGNTVPQLPITANPI